MKSIQETLLLSTEYLAKKGIANARREAEEALSVSLGMSRMDLYLSFDRPVIEAELVRCRELLSRRGKGEPYAYINGQVDFYGCQITVNPSVLIPRQETEILVDKIAKELQQTDCSSKKLWDLCCGSGCIGIALKKKFPELGLSLSDISSEALAVAQKNAAINSVEAEFFEGDLFQSLKGKCDYLVCNPPYISEDDFSQLEKEVRDYEPKLALVASYDGLAFYRRIAKELRIYLAPAGKAWFEIGHGQGADVAKIFINEGWKRCRVEKDWAGHDRFFSLENE